MLVEGREGRERRPEVVRLRVLAPARLPPGGGRRSCLDTLKARGEWRRWRDDTTGHSATRACARRSSATGSSLIPMAVFLTFFIYPFFYALYISRFDWGVFGKIETLGLGELPRRCWRRRVLLAGDQEHGSLHRWSSSRSRWRWASTLAVIVNAGLRGRAVLPLGVLLPLARLLRRDHRDRALHPFGRRAPERRSSAASEPWFGDSDTALWALAGLNVWTTSGTMMLFYLAALQAIPTDVYEAAAIDGAKTLADVLEDHVPAA